MKIWGISGALLASSALAFSLLSVSTPGCGCETPLMRFGWELGMPSALIEFNQNDVLLAAEKAYIGSTLLNITPPIALREQPCIALPNSMHCTYWLAKGTLRKTGFEMHFESDSLGNISKIRIEKVNRWL